MVCMRHEVVRSREVRRVACFIELLQTDRSEAVMGRRKHFRTQKAVCAVGNYNHGARVAPSRWLGIRTWQSTASADEPSPRPAPPRPPRTRPRRNFPRAGPWPPRRTPEILAGSLPVAAAGGTVVFDGGGSISCRKNSCSTKTGRELRACFSRLVGRGPLEVTSSYEFDEPKQLQAAARALARKRGLTSVGWLWV